MKTGFSLCGKLHRENPVLALYWPCRGLQCIHSTESPWPCEIEICFVRLLKARRDRLCALRRTNHKTPKSGFAVAVPVDQHYVTLFSRHATSDTNELILWMKTNLDDTVGTGFELDWTTVDA